MGSVGHIDGVPLPLDATDPDELELVEPVAVQPVVDEVLELPTVQAAKEAPKAKRLAQNK